jgi:zinc transport system ATP-binding protein
VGKITIQCASNFRTGNQTPDMEHVISNATTIATTDATATVPALEARNLSVRFGDYLALEEVSFALPAGAFLTVVGPNGGGKTTLLRIFLGLVEPTGGQARAWGQSLDRLAASEVGYVPQVKTMDRLFPARAVELVATGLAPSWPWRLGGERRARAMAALERVGAAALAERPVARLSGGQLQRAYLARAIARHPRLVLLDEPAAGLDAGGEADLYAILENYQRQAGATVVMITHDWDAVHHHATHVLLLNRRVIGFGAPSQALAEDRVERAFGHVGHPHRHDHPYACSHGEGSAGEPSPKQEPRP